MTGGTNTATGFFTIAHLSDIHLGPLKGFTPSHWRLKRGLGYLNWHRGRKKLHRAEAVAMLVDDMHHQAPDHIAVTGDLVNIGLPAEIEAARGWLKGLGPHSVVSVVPGNHDIYVRLRRDRGVARWRDFMTSDGDGADHTGEVQFPFVRRRGRVGIVGVNSALPTAPFVAAGQVPEAELSDMGRVLARLKSEGLCRVVLIHHPPLPGQAPAIRGLRNAAAFAEVLAREGAELVLHGHNHSNSLAWAGEGNGRVPVVGIASGSAAQHHKGLPLARYNLVRFGFEGDCDSGSGADGDNRRALKSIEIVGRGLSQPGGEVVELDRQMLDVSSDTGAIGA